MEILETLSKKAEQAEVFYLEAESTEISFEANELKAATVEETRGLALRAVVDGRLGFAAASGQAESEELVENVLLSARYGDRVPLRFPGAAPAPQVQIYDPSLAEVPTERMAEVGHEIIDRLRQVDQDAKMNVDIERSVYRTLLRNSAGAQVSEESSSFSVSITVERVRGDDVLILYDSVEDISFSTNYRELTSRLAKKIELAKHPATLKAGRMPVLFAPAGGLVLLLPILLGINGENVQRGTSPLSDKLGAALFDPQLTIWDDPTIPGRPHSYAYDDEGVPARRKAVISQGRVESFLYDLKTAALQGTESTGNGSRGLFSPPSPSSSNIVVEAGDKPLREILREIPYGLLVEDVLGLGQGNAISGVFSNTLGLAYLIQDGEIIGRVKDVSIAGNIYQDLRQIAALSQERYWVYGHLYLPYILLPELKVVTKAG